MAPGKKNSKLLTRAWDILKIIVLVGAEKASFPIVRSLSAGCQEWNHLSTNNGYKMGGVRCYSASTGSW
jgi:hypothetical protein